MIGTSQVRLRGEWNSRIASLSAISYFSYPLKSFFIISSSHLLSWLVSSNLLLESPFVYRRETGNDRLVTRLKRFPARCLLFLRVCGRSGNRNFLSLLNRFSSHKRNTSPFFVCFNCLFPLSSSFMGNRGFKGKKIKRAEKPTTLHSVHPMFECIPSLVDNVYNFFIIISFIRQSHSFQSFLASSIPTTNNRRDKR